MALAYRKLLVAAVVGAVFLLAERPELRQCGNDIGRVWLILSQ